MLEVSLVQLFSKPQLNFFFHMHIISPIDSNFEPEFGINWFHLVLKKMSVKVNST